MSEIVKIAICDDSKELLNVMYKTIRDDYNKRNITTVIDVFTTGEAVIQSNDVKEYDILFLDICLPGINGFEVAEKINQKDKKGYIIFVTSNSEFVYSCFDYKPFYFIRKDRYQEQIPLVLRKLTKEMQQQATIVLEDKEVLRNERIQDIVYIQSDNHSVIVNLVHKRYSIKCRMEEMENKLVSLDFIRIHRKYLVNIRYIRSVDCMLDEVTLFDGTRLEMSRYQKKEVKQAQLNYRRDVM